jgi:hypothetical protein
MEQPLRQRTESRKANRVIRIYRTTPELGRMRQLAVLETYLCTSVIPFRRWLVKRFLIELQVLQDHAWFSCCVGRESGRAIYFECPDDEFASMPRVRNPAAAPAAPNGAACKPSSRTSHTSLNE